MSEPVVALVVAAGSGVRLGESTAGGTGPKGLRRLMNVPLVRWSVDAMAAGGATEAVVVVPRDSAEDFRTALADADIACQLTWGGETRQESVARGLAEIGHTDAVVLVHDAARPLVPTSVTQAVVRAVRGGARAVVPTVAVTDSLREVTADGSRVVDRSRYQAVQTPQGFDLATLRAAHDAAGQNNAYTDDAAVCEAAGHPVVLVPGSRRSLKITEPVDFAFAEALLRSEEA